MIKKAIREFRLGSRSKSLPDVVLHVGAPKAGSSAIQRFCQTNPETLKKLGYFYPDHPLDVNGVSGGHTQLAGALLNGKIEQANERFKEWLSEAKQNNLCLLISGESLYGQAKQMSEITSGLDVKVIAFLRHPVDYLLGNHNQGIKRHMQTRRLEQVLREQAGKPAPHLVGLPLLNWANAYNDEKCEFLPYRSPSQGGEPIEQRFLQALGMSPKESKIVVGEVSVTNRSYVVSALELKRLLNFILPELPDEVAHRVDWGLQGYSDQAGNEYGLSQEDIIPKVRQQLLNNFLLQMEPVVKRFPALKEVMDFPLISKKNKKQSRINLEPPLVFLERREPEIMSQIRQTARSLRDNGLQGYSFFKLLDILDVEFEEPKVFSQPLSDSAKEVLSDKGSREADILREMALLLERLDYLEDAMFVISLALARRPAGKRIQHIYQRISESIKSRNGAIN